MLVVKCLRDEWGHRKKAVKEVTHTLVLQGLNYDSLDIF
jgi:hypothetical protein